MLSYSTLPCSLNFPTTSFCPIPSPPWRPLHFLLVTIMKEQRDGLPVSQAGKEGTRRLVTRSSYLPSSPSLGLLTTLWPAQRRCWEEPLTPPPHTRGRMCSQRCPLWACFLSDGNKTEILNLWAVFVPCCPLVGCCVEKHWYIGNMWRVHVQKRVVRSCTDVVAQRIVMHVCTWIESLLYYSAWFSNRITLALVQ